MPTNLQQRIENRIAKKQQYIDEEMSKIEQERQTPEPVDLSAIMSFVDSTTGSKLSRGYQKPQSKADKLARREQNLQKQQMGLMDDEIQMLRLLDQKQAREARRIEKKKAKEKPKELTGNLIKTLNEGNAIPDMLANVEGLITENQDKFGPMTGRFAENNPYDTRAQGINAEMRAKSQAFGRFMEGGVLRKEDEEKYRKMFPSLSDTPAVAKKKLEVVNDLLRKKQQSDLDAFSAQGYDIRGLNMPQLAPGPADSGDELDNMSDAQIKAMYDRMKGNAN